MTLTDYTSHDGFMMASVVKSYGADGKMTMEATLKNLQNNAGVSDDVFARPEPEMSEK
ncbi:MAG: hypothetical protein ACE5I1_25055 [bacterium]